MHDWIVHLASKTPWIIGNGSWFMADWMKWKSRNETLDWAFLMHFLKLFEVTWKLVCLQDLKDFLNMYKCCPLCRLLELVLRSSPQWVALELDYPSWTSEKGGWPTHKNRVLYYAAATQNMPWAEHGEPPQSAIMIFMPTKCFSKNFQAHPTIGTPFLFFKEPELGWLQKCPSRKLIFVPSLSLPPDGSVSSKRPLENTRPALGRQAGLG